MLVLQLDIKDLNAYIDMINCQTEWLDSVRLTDDEAFYGACEKYLLPKINRLRILRCSNARRFFSQLSERKVISPVKVKVHPFRKGWAYMLDRGEIHLLSDLIYKSGATEFIAVLLHECAHVVLSQTDSYSGLLSLDMQFAQKYLKGQHDELLKAITPVEFFAQLVSLRWFTELSKRSAHQVTKKSLDDEGRKIFQKLDSAVELLNTTIQKNTKNEGDST